MVKSKGLRHFEGVGVAGACLLSALVAGCVRGAPPTQVGSTHQPPSGNDESAAPTWHISTETRPSAYFVRDGKPYCFAGANNYYLTYKSRKMVDDVLKSAVAMNLKVIRVWGFLDIGALDGSVSHVDGDGKKEGVYFQYWDPAKRRPSYNDSLETGLGRLDYVLHKAREVGLTVLVVLTNNWKEFGGMDQYLRWYGVEHHHQFYTDARVRAAYRGYVQHLIERKNAIDGVPYRDDPAIFAWELANEPRAKNTGPLDSDSGWDKSTITTWASEMSAYIKSLDLNHMVSVGDEGFLSSKGHWIFESRDGVYHEDLTALEHIDFSTFHLYPDHWQLASSQSERYLVEQLELARSLGKPAVLEEYGVGMRRDDPRQMEAGLSRRRTAYANFNELLLRRGGAGSLFWMLSARDDAGALYPDYDHYTIYPGEPSHRFLSPYLARFSSEAQACAHAVNSSADSSPYVRAVRLRDATNKKNNP